MWWFPRSYISALWILLKKALYKYQLSLSYLSLGDFGLGDLDLGDPPDGDPPDAGEPLPGDFDFDAWPGASGAFLLGFNTGLLSEPSDLLLELSTNDVEDVDWCSFCNVISKQNLFYH